MATPNSPSFLKCLFYCTAWNIFSCCPIFPFKLFFGCPFPHEQFPLKVWMKLYSIYLPMAWFQPNPSYYTSELKFQQCQLAFLICLMLFMSLSCFTEFNYLSQMTLLTIFCFLHDVEHENCQWSTDLRDARFSQESSNSLTFYAQTNHTTIDHKWTWLSGMAIQTHLCEIVWMLSAPVTRVCKLMIKHIWVVSVVIIISKD